MSLTQCHTTKVFLSIQGEVCFINKAAVAAADGDKGLRQNPVGNTENHGNGRGVRRGRVSHSGRYFVPLLTLRSNGSSCRCCEDVTPSGAVNAGLSMGEISNTWLDGVTTDVADDGADFSCLLNPERLSRFLVEFGLRM